MFLADIEVTYFITISPSQTTTTGLSSVKHHHITASATVQESLLLALPGACNFLRTAINNKEQVLVHCRTEMRACIVIAAYSTYERSHIISAMAYSRSLPCKVMLSQNISLAKASSVLEDGKRYIVSNAFLVSEGATQRFRSFNPPRISSNTLNYLKPATTYPQLTIQL